ncbi:MAG: transcriptional repressor NrdR [Chlamydiae bacterium]|nr:transcriptional repressor NrdR [Chlamydiota bacterium]MBI3276517.1 transcriptional repressor NrdR [Chlamydiota bacterium]
MKCPFCAHLEDRVVDSRESGEGFSIRRRRECLSCQRRFTTYEKIEEIPLKVIKKDDTREDYDRRKILSGMLKACEKRPISVEQIEGMVDEIERAIEKGHEQEVSSKEIGELVMEKLHHIDEVAYVRFASVYRQFKDVNEFMEVIKKLLKG